MLLAPSLTPLALALALLLLSRWEVAASALPILLVLRGPLALVLVALGTALSLARAGPREPAPLPSVKPRALFLAASAFFVVIGLWYTSRLRVTGDEPHYLVMARSLWRDGDLDLRDNYEREDWRADTEGPLRPHYGAPRADGRPFPAHSPGLPLLLAPVDALGGRKACVILLSLLAAWLTVEVHALALRATGDASAAALAWAVAAGPPVAFYAFHIYTEVPSALALALGLRLLTPGAGAGAAIGAALAASALPWLHVKMVLPAMALGVVALLRLRDRPRLVFLAVATAMATAYVAYHLHVFAQASPLAIYGGMPRDASGSPLRGLAGLLLDRSFGLLPHAPAFLLALAGFAAFRGAREGEVFPHVLVAAAVLAPVLPWRMFWGGQCPPARFLVPLVPFLATAAALRCVGLPRGLARWRNALLALGFGLVAFAVADPGRLLLVNRANLPSRLWAAIGGEGSLGRYLPSLVRADAAETRVTLVWIVVLFTLLMLDRLARRRNDVDRLFRGLGLPIVVFLAIGVFVDGWARSRDPRGREPAVVVDEPGDSIPGDPPTVPEAP